MADYDMDYDICTGCKDIYEFCQLTDYLISDIQHLESEVVRLRYVLSSYLSKQDCEMLRCDILSDLAGRYYWHTENLERDIAELLTRPVGRPSHKPVVWYKGFLYQAASWKTARRVVAKVEFHFGGCSPESDSS